MCQIVITPDNREHDTAQDLVDWLTKQLGHPPKLVIHPTYQKSYHYDPEHCLCPFDLEKTFAANGIRYKSTPTGDFQLV